MQQATQPADTGRGVEAPNPGMNKLKGVKSVPWREGVRNLRDIGAKLPPGGGDVGGLQLIVTLATAT